MATYAQIADVKAYTDLEALAALDDAAITKLIERAELDVDQALGVYVRADDSPLKINPDDLSANNKTTLNNATCAQVEYRYLMGPEFFIRAQYAKVTGPEFSTEGTLPRVGPKTWQALEGTDLLRLTTSWGGVGDDPPWRDFAYG